MTLHRLANLYRKSCVGPEMDIFTGTNHCEGHLTNGWTISSWSLSPPLKKVEVFFSLSMASQIQHRTLSHVSYDSLHLTPFAKSSSPRSSARGCRSLKKCLDKMIWGFGSPNVLAGTPLPWYANDLKDWWTEKTPVMSYETVLAHAHRKEEVNKSYQTSNKNGIRILKKQWNRWLRWAIS